MMPTIKKLQYVACRYDVSVATIAKALSEIQRANAEELFLKAYNYAILEPRTALKAVGYRLFCNSFSHDISQLDDFSRKMSVRLPGALPISEASFMDSYNKTCKINDIWTTYLKNPKGYFMEAMRILLKDLGADCWDVFSALTVSHDLAVRGGTMVNLNKLLETLDVGDKPACDLHRKSAAVATLLAELVAGSMYAHAEAASNMKVRERVVHFFEEYPKLQKKLDKEYTLALHREFVMIDIFSQPVPAQTGKTQSSKPADTSPKAQESLSPSAVTVSETASEMKEVSKSPDVMPVAEAVTTAHSEVVPKPESVAEAPDFFEINKEMQQGLTDGVLVEVKVTLKVKPSALQIKEVDVFKKQVADAGYVLHKTYQDAETALHRKLKSVYEEVEDKKALEELEAAVKGLSPRALALYRQLTQK